MMVRMVVVRMGVMGLMMVMAEVIMVMVGGGGS